MRYPDKKILKTLGGCLALLWLTGCSLTAPVPPAALPAAVPGTWSASVSPDALPVASGLMALIESPELDALVQEAMENNPDLQATALRLRSAQYLLSQPRSRRLPKLDAGISRARNNQEYNYTTMKRELQTTHKVSATLSWEMDLWGRLADEYEAEHLEVSARQESYLLARDALAARVIQAWIKQKAARRAMAIETRRLAVFQQIEDILSHRYRDGLGSRDEYAAARTRTQVAKADLSVQQVGLDQSVRSIEVLLGRYPRGELSCGRDWPALTLPAPDTPAAVLSRRPDIKAGLARVRAAQKKAGAADKALLPGLNLSADLFRSGTRLSDITGATTYWGLLGSLFQPVFQGGRLRDTAKAMHSQAEAAVFDLHAVVLKALNEVEAALTLEKELAVQAKALKIAVDASETSSRYFAERYRQGLDNIQTLFTAREQEISAKLRLNQARADRLSNRIDLALALGTGL